MTREASNEQVLEERREKLTDVKDHVTALLAALECAETCENADDFFANVEDARAAAKEISAVLTEVVAS